VSGTLLDRLRRSTAALLLGAGFAFVLAYLFVAVSRMRYPFELEWMEGGMVDHVRRVLAGLPIYAKPSIDFVSFLYPPLYYEAAAVFARVFGPGFFPLRLLSFLSSVGVFALLYAIVRRESGAWFPGAVAVSLFAATYDRVGGWFDIARLDSFYLLLLLTSVYALRFAASPVAAAVAGLSLGAAFLTKQSALVVALPLVVCATLADIRRAPWFAAAAGLVMGGGILWLDRSTGRWFHYYCIDLPSRHPRVDGGWADFLTADLLPALPVATLAAIYYAVTRVRAEGGASRFFYPFLAAGMLGSSWAVRNMVGAEVNNLLPAFAAVAILAALGLHELLTRASAAATSSWKLVAIGAQVALLAQLAYLGYDPRKHIPSAADRAAGDQLVARLATIPGEIFVPHHGYLARLAGKRDYAHTLAMDNVFLDDEGDYRRDLEAEMLRALGEKRFSAVLLESDGRYAPEISTGYEAKEKLFDRTDVFWPVTGGRLRPEVLCVPK
jgi:Dolichyl-phosphate-mannose-protein mannosyltransferase